MLRIALWSRGSPRQRPTGPPPPTPGSTGRFLFPPPGLHSGIMEITLIIVGGLTLMTLIGVSYDYLVKKRTMVSNDTVQRLAALEQQVKALEIQSAAKDDQIARLEEGMGFVNRLLEDKTASRRQP
jgi:hypothetical protein